MITNVVITRRKVLIHLGSVCIRVAIQLDFCSAYGCVPKNVMIIIMCYHPFLLQNLVLKVRLIN